MTAIRTLVLATVMAVGLPAPARAGTGPAPEEQESSATVLAQPSPNGEASLETPVGTPATRSGAGNGLFRGMGFVLAAWGYACIIGGPFTLVICIVGFPEYWPYLVAAVVVGGGIGALVGAAAGSPSSGCRRRQRLHRAPGPPANGARRSAAAPHGCAPWPASPGPGRAPSRAGAPSGRRGWSARALREPLTAW
jgi:hypothetical protein